MMRLGLLLLCILTSGASCQIEKLFPARVADGVARLTVANIALVMMGRYQQEKQNHSLPDDCRLILISKHTGTVIEGEAQTLGSVTQIFSKCDIDFGDNYEVRDLENRLVGHVSGKVQVSGKRVVKGYLTGNDIAPVIPQGADSIHFEFSEILFENFKAQLADLDKDLSILKGRLSLSLDLHLARNKDGLCADLQPNITLKKVKYENSTIARLPGMFGYFDIDIGGSQFEVQQDIYENKQNLLTGNMTVWGKNITLNSDKHGLNPNFNANNIRAISYECPVDQFLAVSTARLLMLNVGMLSLHVVNDKSWGQNCSPTNWNMLQPLHKISENEASREVDQCIISASEAYELDRDCQGNPTVVQGSAIVSYQTKLHGKWVGYFSRPIPHEPENTHLKFSEVIFHDYTISTQFAKLALKSGSLSGSITPIQAAQKQDPCIFDVPTPHIFIRDIRSHKIHASLEVDLTQIPSLEGMFRFKRVEDTIIKLPMHIDESRLSAQNGAYAGTQNWLTGYIKINQQLYNFSEQTLLDPKFNQETFDATYQCQALHELIQARAGWKPNANCPPS